MDSNAVERRKRHISEPSDVEEEGDHKRVRPLPEQPGSLGRHHLPDGQQGPYQSGAHPPSPPESEEEDDEEEISSSSSSEEDDQFALAGYEYCSKEAIRYLMEEEKLDSSHPVIQQLQRHLNSRRSRVMAPQQPSSSNHHHQH